MSIKTIISILLVLFTIFLVAGVAYIFSIEAKVKEVQISVNEVSTGLNVIAYTKTDGFGSINNVANISITYNNQTTYNSTVTIKNDIGEASVKYEEFYKLNGNYTIIVKCKDKSAESKKLIVKTVEYVKISATPINDTKTYEISLSFISNMSTESYNFVRTKGNGTISVLYNASGSNVTNKAYEANFIFDGLKFPSELAIGSKRYSVITESIKINYTEFVSGNNNGTYLVKVNFTNSIGTALNIVDYDPEPDEIEFLLIGGKDI